MDAQKLAVISEFLKQKESRFASLEYTNAHGETALYLIHLNVNRLKILRRDMKRLQAIDPTTLDELHQTALANVKASVQKSIDACLAGTVSEDYTKKDYYEYLVPGRPVKYNSEGRLYVNAFKVSKRVITPGVYKTVKSRPLTIAQNEFKKLLKGSDFREFILDEASIGNVKVNGKVLEISRN